MNVLEKILEEIDEQLRIIKNIPDREDGDFMDGEECYEDGRVQGRYEELVRCKEIIRSHMGEMENGGWIPVEDKQVPEKEVIAQNVYDEMMIGYVYYSEEMGWYECVSDDVYLTNVVAWQPRPKSYKKHRQ